MKSLIAILTILVIAFQSLNAQQEKRLALVIGNANYDKGALNNPVNDALLMEKTLKYLDFDVILDTNISTLQDFNKTVLQFGEKRGDYEVAFIYYAGHGVQINNTNYLLATKESYESELGVKLNAFSVQQIMTILTNKTNQVNVLILDACRDNPFEQNWNPQARSTDGGRGLAKIPAPTGSLIAYSTDAGNTAADGDGTNSIYCLSLTKNMQIENTTLDQVFRNVRTDVLKASGGSQRPVEASQLTGDAFYLKKGTFSNEIILIDSLIEVKDYKKGLELVIAILNEDKNNKSALIRKGRLYNIDGENELAKEAFDLAINLYPRDKETFMYRGRYYFVVDEKGKALQDLHQAIELDSNYVDAYFYLGLVYQDLENADKALSNFTKAIELDDHNSKIFGFRGDFFEKILKDYNAALLDYSEAIKLNPNLTWNLYKRARLNYLQFSDYDSALEDCRRILKIDNGDINAINLIGLIYENQGQITLAIKEYEKGIALENTNPKAAAFCYRNRADIFETQEKYINAIDDYTKAIELNPNATNYKNRGDIYRKYLREFNLAILDYTKSIEFDPNNKWTYYHRGNLYTDQLNDDASALNDFRRALTVDPEFINVINAIGLLYEKKGELELALQEYEKGIELETTNPKSAATCYANRADLLAVQGKYETALADYSKAIELDPKNPNRYIDRYSFHYKYSKDYMAALNDISAAIELEPNNTTYLYDRGRIFQLHLNNMRSALSDYKKLLEIDPKYIGAINNIGVIYVSRGEYELAIEQYEKGIVFESTNPEWAALCYVNRADLRAIQGNNSDALADYTKAIELDSDNSFTHRKRGLYYKNQSKEYNAALIDFTKAIELLPSDTEVRMDRGHLFQFFLDDPESALKDYESILKIDPSHIGAINNIGIIHESQGNTNLALQNYEKGIALEETNPESAANCYFNRARIHINQDKYDDALSDISRAIELDDDKTEFYHRRAFIYKNGLKKYNLAILDYSKCIELEPGNKEHLYKRASMFYKMGDLKNALIDFNNVLEIDPSYVKAINIIGLIYEEQGKTENAIETYNSGISLHKEYPLAAAYCYRNRADLHVKNGNYEAALDDYTKSIELDPKNPKRYSKRASFYQQYTKKHNEALIDLSAAIQLEPTDPDNFYNRGRHFHLYIKNDESAIKDYKSALELDSTHVISHNNIGLIYQNLGEIEQALEQYQKAIELKNIDPKSAALSYRNRAALYIEQKKMEMALIDVTSAIEIDPENPEQYRARAYVYQNYLREFKLAILDHEKCIELEPENPIHFYYRAKLHHQLKQIDSAEDDYSKCIKLFAKINPNHPFYINERALFYSKIGNHKKALQDFDKVLMMDSTDRTVYYHRSKMYIKQKEFDKAKADCEKTIEMDENDPEGYYYLAEIYNLQENYFKALKNYNQALFKLGGEMDYYISNDDGSRLPESGVHIRLGDLYLKVEENEMACEEYNKALELMKDEPFYMNKEKDQKDLEEKTKNLCN